MTDQRYGEPLPLPWNRFGEPATLPSSPPTPPPPPPPPAPPTSVPDPEPSQGVWVTQLGGGSGGGGGSAAPWVPGTEAQGVAEDMRQALAQDDYNLQQLAGDAFKTALDEALPGLKQNAMDFLQASIRATVKGEEVDWAHPTVTATTAQGRELVIADAKSRSWRTLTQGLIFDLFAAIVAAIALLAGADPFAKETWIAFGVLLVKSVVSAVISYFMRLRVAPTMKVDDEKVKVLPVPGAAVESRAA